MGTVRRCLYGKDVFEYTLEYGKQFWKEYESTNKFLYLDFIDGHELTMEVIKKLDNRLPEYLDEMKEMGAFKNTAVIFMSDHGYG